MSIFINVSLKAILRSSAVIKVQNYQNRRNVIFLRKYSIISETTIAMSARKEAPDSIRAGLSLSGHHDLPNAKGLGSIKMKAFIKAVFSKMFFCK